MSDELKPCPFCGGEAEMREGSSTKPYIRCKRCGCRTGSSRYRGNLAKAWNARADATDEQFSLAVHDGRVWQVARTCGEYRGNVYETTDGTSDDIELWCEHCDIPLEDGWRHCPNCGAKVTR